MIIIAVVGSAVVFVYIIVATVYSVMRNAPQAARPTPITSIAPTGECPQVNTLEPSAFAGFPAGSCITLMPPAAMKPEAYIWCPVNGDLPLAGNRLDLIGDVKTMLKREGDSFSVVTPDREKGVIFVPLEHSNGDVVLNAVSLFREQGSQHYTCLVDTLVSIP